MQQRAGSETRRPPSLRCLDPQLLEKIDSALCEAGPFGEVRLIVVKGRLRFIQVLRSDSVLQTQPGDGE
jgi:hypothetical protein